MTSRDSLVPVYRIADPAGTDVYLGECNITPVKVVAPVDPLEISSGAVEIAELLPRQPSEIDGLVFGVPPSLGPYAFKESDRLVIFSCCVFEFGEFDAGSQGLPVIAGVDDILEYDALRLP